MSFFVKNEGMLSRWWSCALIYPSLASCPATDPAECVTIFTILSVAWVLVENFGGSYGIWRNPSICVQDRLHVKTGSATWPGFHVISFLNVVAERLIFGVILALKLVSPNSFFPRSFSIWSTAKPRSSGSELAKSDTSIHSGWAYQAPVQLPTPSDCAL